MALTITEPNRVINGIETKAIAGRSQILYNILRKDFLYTEVQSADGGNQSAFVVVSHDMAIGDLAVIVDDAGVYGGLHTVNVVTPTIIQFLIPFVSDSTGYVNNISGRTKYRIQIGIFRASDNFKLFGQDFNYVPNQSGTLDIDLGALITGFMRTPGSFVFSLEYYLIVQEFYGGSSTSPTQTGKLQAVLSFKQILKQGGALMWENLLRISSAAGASEDFTGTQASGNDVRCLMPDTSGWAVGTLVHVVSNDGLYDFIEVVVAVQLNTYVQVENAAYLGDAGAGTVTAINASFQTQFKNPIFWRGWNRSINFLMDAEYVNRVTAGAPNINQRPTDINKSEIGGDQFTATSLNINTFFYTLLPAHVDAAFESVMVRNNLNSDSVSETIYFEVNDECLNPIMLDWINSKGGAEQWLFVIDQIVLDQSGAGVLAEAPINSNIETILRTKRRFPGASIQRITLVTENLTDDQLRGLQEIKQTESLRVYLSKDGANFVDAVVVEDFSTEYTTRGVGYTFRVMIEFPDGFDFFEGKLY